MTYHGALNKGVLDRFLNLDIASLNKVIIEIVLITQ